MTDNALKTPLHDVVRQSNRLEEAYRQYQPDKALLAQVTAALPAARVVVVTESWCPDSRRQIPRLARIAEHLPGWTFELHPWDAHSRGAPWQVRAIPTVIIYEGDRELGRIVERPTSGSLELDLLSIAGTTAS